jgi:Nuclease-related domain/UvrD-like helicase C-terminal domain/AAA domain
LAIFPQGKTRVRERCNAGEKRVMDALARCLEDDYIVYHNIPIAPLGKEPDFVLLHPARGLLILEVKDWRLSTIADANPMVVTLRKDGQNIVADHPLSQARAYAQEATHLLQKDPALLHAGGRYQGQLIFPWGWGAALSRVRREQVAADDSFAQVFPPERVLLADDLDDETEPMVFQQKLWGMFSVSWQAALTLPQLGLVRGHLYPELRMGVQQALPLQESANQLVVQDLMQVMDLNQEEIARGLGAGHRIIHGAAGSGKTMVLVFRAVQLQAAARPDKPILVLCYNQSLASRIDSLLRAKGVGPAVQVRTFHAWAIELINTYQLAPVRQSGQSKDEHYAALAARACEGIAARRVPSGQYTSILIDEAHDLQDTWLAAAAKMVDPESRSLLILYDDAQSIYQKERRQLNFASLGIEAKGRTRVLKVNYRNTTEVLALAMECANAVLKPRDSGDEDQVPLVQPQSSGRSGPLPRLLLSQNVSDQAAAVVQGTRQALARGMTAGQIAVLGRTKDSFAPVEQALKKAGIAYESQRDITPRHMQWSAPSVKLLTLHSVKGLEFKSVHIISLHDMPHPRNTLEDELRLLYVGMTRATHELSLYAAADSPITQRVQAALHTVRERFG